MAEDPQSATPAEQPPALNPGSGGPPLEAPPSEDDLKAIEEQIRQEQIRQQGRIPPNPGAIGPGVVPTPEGGFKPALSPEVVKDIAGGVAHTPRAVYGGAVDATNETIETVWDLGNWMDAHVADLSTGIGPKTAPRVSESLTPGEPTTGTEAVIRSMAAFLVPFKGIGMVAKGLRIEAGATTAGQIARASARGAIADTLAFDEHQERLSNLLDENPALQGPVLDYLSADPNDGFAEGKLKQAIEGLGLGVLTEGFVLSIRAMKMMARARRAKIREESGYIGDAPPPAERELPLSRMQALGLFDLPPVARLSKAKLQQMMAEKAGAAQLATEGIEPEQLFGLMKVGEDAGEGVYINFAHLDTREDVLQVVDYLSKLTGKDLKAKKRGVVTWVQTANEAEQVNAFNLLISRRKGQALNAAQLVALRRLWVASAEKMTDLAYRSVQAPTEENRFMARRMVQVFYAIQAEALGAQAEAGRALNILRMPVTGSDKQRLAHIQQMLGEVSPGEVTDAMLAKIAGYRNQPGRVGELGAAISRSKYAKRADVFQQLWISGLLMNPKTHMRNILSNVAFAFVQIPERALAARMGVENGVEIGEAMAYMNGMTRATMDAFAAAAKAARTNSSSFGLGRIEGPRQGALSPQALGMVPNSPWAGAMTMIDATSTGTMRALMAADEFFKFWAYDGELWAQAYRKTAREVRAGTIENTDKAKSNRMAQLIADPPAEIEEAAIAQAQYATFTDKPGWFVQNILNLRRGGGGQGAMASVVRATAYTQIPFLTTPGNLFKRGFERTPLAPLVGEWLADYKAGGARKSLAMARMGWGSALVWSTMNMAASGMATDGGPAPGTAQNAQWSRSHVKWSIRTGYDEKGDPIWQPYDRFDPLGTQIGWAAALTEYAVNMDWEDPEVADNYERVLTAMLFSAAHVAVDKSFTQGVYRLMEAVHDGNAYGDNWWQQMAGTMVPGSALMGEVRRQTDPQMRYVTNSIEAMKNRMPGMSKDLPAIYDAWGRPRLYESGLGEANDILNPFTTRKIMVEPIDKELARLNEEAPDAPYLGNPSRVLSFPMIGGDAVTLNLRNRMNIYSRYTALAGNELKLYENLGLRDFINDVVQGKSAWSAVYESQQTAYAKVVWIHGKVTEYRAAARVALLNEFPELHDELATKGRKQTFERRGLDLRIAPKEPVFP